MSRPEDLKITRESLLDVGNIVIAGRALKLIVSIDDCDEKIENLIIDCLRKHERDVEKRASASLKEAFGNQSKDYILGPIVFTHNCMCITVYGQHKERRSSGTYGGERWVGRADKFQFLMRKHTQNLLRGASIFNSVGIDVTWEPGDGIQCFDYLVDPRSQDPSLSAEIRRLRDTENRFRRNRTIFLIFAPVVALVIGISFLLVYHNSDVYNRGLHLFLTAIFWTYLVIPLAILGILSWANYGSIGQEIHRKEASLDLRSVLNKDEQNAYKLFQLNSSELKRYYDQALKQRALVFILGILCISGGFVVVGVTIYVLVNSLAQANISEKLIVGGLGAIAGILANFIAVIFLRMFESIVTSMVKFHNRLVLTNYIYFGNLLLARVSDPKLKAETLSKLALTLPNLYGLQSFNEEIGNGAAARVKDSSSRK